MTKRVGRLVVASSFLTFAMVITLWIRMEVNFREGRPVTNNRYPDQPVNLGGGLFPDSWRWSPGGLARNYPAGSNLPVELPTWEETQVEVVPNDIRKGEGDAKESTSDKLVANNNDKVSDIWYRGFLLNKKAEEFANEGKLLEALNSYNEALPLMKAVLTEFPDFHHQIVKKRISLIVHSRNQIKSELIRNEEFRLD